MNPKVCALTLAILMAGSPVAFAQWRMVSEGDARQNYPGQFASGGKEYKPGDEWPRDQRFRWLVGELEIPATIDGQSTGGKQLGCGSLAAMAAKCTSPAGCKAGTTTIIRCW